MNLAAAPVGETRFDELKRYVRFGLDDAAALASFRAHAHPEFPRIAEAFYDRLREHEAAHDVFTGEAQVERLKRSMVSWLHRICSGPYDQAYFEETAKIGRVHEKVGLPQRYMFAAMALIHDELLRIAELKMGTGAWGALRAIGKILHLELAVMLDTYGEETLARAQRSDRLERDAMGRTLARTEHRYKNAVELARVLIVGLDTGGVVRLFTRAAARVTGMPREDVLGAAFVETLMPPEVRADHGALLRAVAAGKRPETEVLVSAIRTRSGKIRDVRWQLAYTPSDADDEVVLFAIGQDITDQNALSARVRQAEKLAAVGTLAAGLAHEIRNPLNGAQLHVTFLARGLKRAGYEDPETMEAVKIVQDEIRRLSALVSEFLDFARPKPLLLKPSSIHQICGRAIQLVAPDAAAQHVTIRPDLPAADIELEVDPARVEQVVLNLLANAVDAVGSVGGGAVVVRARRHPRHVLLEVEDEGPGLPSPDAPIFDPFFSTKPHGTGLGLAIVHRIVTDHEGTIDFQSRPGRTVFQVTLPIRIATA